MKNGNDGLQIVTIRIKQPEFEKANPVFQIPYLSRHILCLPIKLTPQIYILQLHVVNQGKAFFFQNIDDLFQCVSLILALCLVIAAVDLHEVGPQRRERIDGFRFGFAVFVDNATAISA